MIPPPLVEPMVSVCLPIGNTCHFLEQTIASVIKQSFSAWEFIVLVHGDSASTNEIVQTYAASDERIIAAQRPGHYHQAKAFNEAISLSRGRYIKLLAGGDELHPDCLKKLVHAAESNPSVQLFSVSSTFSEQPKTTATANYLDRPGLISGSEVAKLYLRQLIDITGGASQMFFRRSENDFASALDYGCSWSLALALSLLTNSDFFLIAEPLVLRRGASPNRDLLGLQEISFLTDQVRLLDSFGHRALAPGESENELWDCLIRALLRKMESATKEQEPDYKQFSNPPQWLGASFPNNEPALYWRLASYLFQYLTAEHLTVAGLRNLQDEKSVLAKENQHLLERMQALEKQVYELNCAKS